MAQGYEHVNAYIGDDATKKFQETLNNYFS